MKIKTKTILLLFIMAACAFACGAPKQKTIDVTILFFNDLHGYLLPFQVKGENGQKVEAGGIARLGGLVKKIRAENEAKGAKTVVLVAGDILQGTPMSTVFHGKPDVEALNMIGVDAMTVGNHEFDFGLDNFLTLQNLARFPFLSANIFDKPSGKPLADSFAAINLAPGLDLIVIGATTPELLVTTKPENVATLEARDPTPLVKETFDKLKNRGPVLLLSHCRHQTDRATAEAVPGLAAIIAGHDQLLFNPHRQAGAVPVYEAFEKGRYLGRLDLRVDPRAKRAEITGSEYIPITAALPADPEIAALIESYHTKLDANFKEVIGVSEAFLDGERERIRYEETGLGNFVTDVMRQYTGAQIALLNAGSLRASIDQGPITVETVFKTMPYENELITVNLTGAEILEALARAVQGERSDEDGGFLHVSGISFKIRGKEVREVMVGGVPLDPAATYSAAITDFMASGGDGYTLFIGKDAVRTGLPLRELLVETIRERQKIAAPPSGRIDREGA